MLATLNYGANLLVLSFIEIFTEEQNFAVLSCACQNNGTLVGSKVISALFPFLKENSFYIHKFSQDFSHQHTDNTCSKC